MLYHRSHTTDHVNGLSANLRVAIAEP